MASSGTLLLLLSASSGCTFRCSSCWRQALARSSTPLFCPLGRGLLTQGADASATVTTFARETEKSDMLMLTHHALLNCPQLVQASAKVDLGQLRGDANICSDAVSRSYWDVFYRLCRNLRIRPVESPVPVSAARRFWRRCWRRQRRVASAFVPTCTSLHRRAYPTTCSTWSSRRQS